MTSPPELAARTDVRSAIVDAAAALLRQGGGRALTTRAVAQAAGVPAPTIFRLFGDKDGLLDAVAEHVMATYVAEKAVPVADENGDPVAALRQAWRRHVEFGLTHPDLFVLLVTPGRLAHSAATQAGFAQLAARVARLAAAGLLRVSEARAVAMIHAAGSGVVLALLDQPEESRDAGLAEATLEAVMGRILTSRPAPPADELATLVVAFRSAVPELPTLSAGEKALLSEWLGRTVAELQNA